MTGALPHFDVAVETLRTGEVSYAPAGPGFVLCILPTANAVDAILTETGCGGANADHRAIARGLMHLASLLQDVVPHEPERCSAPVFDVHPYTPEASGESFTPAEADSLRTLCEDMPLEARDMREGERIVFDLEGDRWSLALLPRLQFYGLDAESDAERMFELVERVCLTHAPEDAGSEAMMESAHAWLTARLADLRGAPDALGRAIALALADPSVDDDGEGLDVAELARVGAAGGPVAAILYALRFMPEGGPDGAALYRWLMSHIAGDVEASTPRTSRVAGSTAASKATE